MPCGAPVTLVHEPTLPGTSHAWHWPLQAWLQQNPSAQWAFLHALESVQAAPSSSLPMHWPPEQYEPAAQSLSPVQVELQAVAPQPYTPHAWVWRAGHEPPPHDAANVSTPALHEAPRHCAVG